MACLLRCTWYIACEHCKDQSPLQGINHMSLGVLLLLQAFQRDRHALLSCIARQALPWRREDRHLPCSTDDQAHLPCYVCKPPL